MKLTLDSGTLVADRFRIVRFLAEGGMGEVYEARDEVLGDAVALKFLSQRSMDDEVVQRRFRREIQLARKVTHPNVCRLFDVFRYHQKARSGHYEITFVTMELLLGETLEDRLERDGRLSETEALPVAEQMCRALAAAHEVGIVHRDFKTSNVMLVPRDDERLRAVVTDFGLARSMYPHDPSRTPLTADQLILGTADYMSPEQVTGDPVSPRSDVYSLGVVLFEMVTGGRPHPGPNPVQVLMQRMSQDPAAPSSFLPEISGAWEETILRCLETDPDARPQSALEVFESLAGSLDPAQRQSFVQGDPSSAWIPQPADDDAGTRGGARRETTGWTTAGTEGSVPLGDARSFWIAAALAACLVLGLGLVALLLLRESPDEAGLHGEGTSSEGPVVFSPRRVTTEPGLEIDPALSPDGTRVAYAAEGSDGRFRLQLQSLDATSPARTLAAPLTGTFEPAWSPDGERLAFHVRGEAGGLWILDVDSPVPAVRSAPGTPPRRVVDFGARPSWSPDARHLAFQSLPSPLLSDTTVPAPEGSRIEVVDLESGATRVVTRSGSPAGGHATPAWTPDGRHLVFNAVSRADGAIWAVPFGTDLPADAFPLVRDVTAFDPVVSSDGRHVYFTSRSREVKGLWRLRVDPQTLEPLEAPQEVGGVGLSSIRQPSVSPAGGLIFSAYLTRSNLHATELAGRALRPGASRSLTSGNDRYNRPSFSPSGDALAFDHWKLGVDIDVYVQPLVEGGARRQLSDGEGTHSHASWLRDGRVAYTDDREGARRVVAVDPSGTGDSGTGDGGEEELLYVLDPAQDWAVVSPDGRWLAFHGFVADEEGSGEARESTSPDLGAASQEAGSPEAEGFEIWVAPLPLGRAFVATRHETFAGFPSWSPDGRLLAYQVRREGRQGTDVWVMPFADGIAGEPRRVTDEPGHSWPYSFSPDGRHIAFAALRDGHWSLRWVDRTSGETGVMVESRNRSGYLRYPLLSPAGDLLVYERAETLSDLFVVEGLR